MKKFNIYNVPIFLIMIMALATCGRHKIKPNISAEERMNKAVEMFNDEDYLDARTEFHIIILNSPGGPLSDQAQFYYAECHFQLKEYILAIAEYEKLARVYPNSEYVDDAHFKIGLSNFKMSPRYSLDQNYTEKAIEEFQRFLEEYPGSPLLPEANKYMIKCREKLAIKNFKIAETYRKRLLYRSALIYYDYVLDNYYDTEYAERSLWEKSESYRNLGESEQAEKFYKLYLEKYPRTSKAGHIKDILSILEEKTLWEKAEKLFQNNDPAQAENHYNLYIQKYPKSSKSKEAKRIVAHIKAERLLWQQAENFRLSGNKEAAEKSYESYLAAYPASFKAKSAKELLDSLRSIQIDDKYIAKNILEQGDLCLKAGNIDSASSLYEIIIKKYSHTGFKDEAFLGLACAFRKQERYDKMRLCFEQLEEMIDTNQELSFDLEKIDTVSAIIPSNTAQKITTLSGASLEILPGNEFSTSIDASIKPALLNKKANDFDIYGKAYHFVANQITLDKSVRIALPYDSRWLNSADKRIENFKIYFYVNSSWLLISDSRADTINHVIYADVDQLNLATISTGFR